MPKFTPEEELKNYLWNLPLDSFFYYKGATIHVDDTGEENRITVDLPEIKLSIAPPATEEGKKIAMEIIKHATKTHEED